MSDADPIATLPVAENVRRVLTNFVRKSRQVFDSDLLSVVLYGSAAAGQMRASSDVNLLVVLKQLRLPAGEELSEAVRLAEARLDCESCSSWKSK